MDVSQPKWLIIVGCRFCRLYKYSLIFLMYIILIDYIILIYYYLHQYMIISIYDNIWMIVQPLFWRPKTIFFCNYGGYTTGESSREIWASQKTKLTNNNWRRKHQNIA